MRQDDPHEVGAQGRARHRGAERDLPVLQVGDVEEPAEAGGSSGGLQHRREDGGVGRELVELLTV